MPLLNCPFKVEAVIKKTFNVAFDRLIIFTLVLLLSHEVQLIHFFGACFVDDNLTVQCSLNPKIIESISAIEIENVFEKMVSVEIRMNNLQTVGQILS